MVVLSARFEILLRNYISRALGLLAFIAAGFTLSPATYSALSWLVQKEISMCLT